MSVWQAVETTHKLVQQFSTTRALELLHMDLIGPTQVVGKRYIFVCIWFTWIDFLKEKSNTFDAFRNLTLKLQNEKKLQYWQNSENKK